MEAKQMERELFESNNTMGVFLSNMDSGIMAIQVTGCRRRQQAIDLRMGTTISIPSTGSLGQNCWQALLSLS
jgi:hypothetical protein